MAKPAKHMNANIIMDYLTRTIKVDQTQDGSRTISLYSVVAQSPDLIEPRSGYIAHRIIWSTRVLAAG